MKNNLKANKKKTKDKKRKRKVPGRPRVPIRDIGHYGIIGEYHPGLERRFTMDDYLRESIKEVRRQQGYRNRAVKRLMNAGKSKTAKRKKSVS